MTSAEPAVPIDIQQPLADIAAWTACFRSAEIPVLRQTAETLEALRANEDQTDANSIGEMIAGDPLMTLKVLAYAADHRGRQVVTGIETVTSALVMTGISPFFRAFPVQPTVEDRLRIHPRAMAGIKGVLRRAHRGADLALGFAVHRTAPNAAAIHAAGLLHEFAELLLWVHAPTLALQILKAQQDSPTLRSTAVQREVLRIELPDLQAALVSSWKLPTLLSQSQGESPSSNAGTRTVELAAKLARHTSNGWDNPAVPDDIRDVAALLNLSPAAALHLAMGIAPD